MFILKSDARKSLERDKEHYVKWFKYYDDFAKKLFEDLEKDPTNTILAARYLEEMNDANHYKRMIEYVDALLERLK